MSVYFLTLGTNPLLGDDIHLALLNQSVPLYISERGTLVEGNYDLSTCTSCFYDERLTNDKSFLKPIQPILSIDINGDRYPVFKSRRMGGAPYAFFKLLLKKNPLESAMNIFNLFVGISTLLFMFLAIRKRFDNRLASISVLIASISPIFILSYSYYITEQLIALSFWILFYLIQRDTKTSRILSGVVFIVSTYFKLNFIISVIPLFLFNKDKFLKYYRFCCVVAAVLLVYLCIIFSMGDSISELITRGGEGYRKPLMHIVLWFQEFVSLFSRPSIFLNEQLGIFDLMPTYTNDISYLTIILTGPFVTLFLIYIYCAFKDDDVRLSFLSCFLWALAAFFVGHLDVTYTARFSEVATLMVLTVSLSIVYLLKQSKIFNRGLISIIILSKLYFLVFFVSIYYVDSVENGSLSIRLNKKISNYLIENKIYNPILSRDESEWGVLELHSSGSIRPIYMQNLDDFVSLSRIVNSFNSAYILYSLERETYRNEGGDNIVVNHSIERTKGILDRENIEYKVIKEFKTSKSSVYVLIYFERKVKLPGLSTAEDNKLSSIKYKKIYR
ncbi:hypothetical protein [Halobacteriovorax marinus]|uniref:hypothetical protein n=1 Tax=Halobacteriovorax marinus TaxID=97084 RepID=UPI0005C840C4|nr:hypothetical protein [Halobacteriovorax marinus]